MVETQRIQLAGMVMLASLLMATVAFAQDVDTPDMSVDPINGEVPEVSVCGEFTGEEIVPIFVIDPPPLGVICDGSDETCGEWVDGNPGETGEEPIAGEDGDTTDPDVQEPEILFTIQGNDGVVSVADHPVTASTHSKRRSANWICELLPESALCLVN